MDSGYRSAWSAFWTALMLGFVALATLAWQVGNGIGSAGRPNDVPQPAFTLFVLGAAISLYAALAALLHLPPYQSERAVTPVTPQYLTGFFEGRLDTEGRRLAQPYIDSWMRVDGKIRNVTPRAKSVSVFLNDEAGTPIPAMFTFNRKKDIERLSTIGMGTPIAAVGQIARVEGATVFLSNAKLMSQ